MEEGGQRAGVSAPHDWCIMLPLSQRVQPGVHTVMALSRYRDVLLRQPTPERPVAYPPPIPEVSKCSFFFHVPFALHGRCFPSVCPLPPDALPAICGRGSLLLTPRLDAQTTFAKLFADIGSTNDVRSPDLPGLALGPFFPSSASKPLSGAGHCKTKKGKSETRS